MQHKSFSWRRFLGLGLVLAWLVIVPSARGQDFPEYRLKAAFLYNFVTFTEWPDEVKSTLSVCVYGPDPFASELDPLSGKAAGSRRIELQRKSTLEALKECQVVFVSAPAIGQLPQLLDTLRGLPALIVADSPGAIWQGAMLNMNVVQGRITFEANLLAARSARLNLSSKLLRLATEVVQ